MRYSKEEYQERIGRAKAPISFVVVTYDVLLDYISNAAEAIKERDYPRAAEQTEKARECVCDLLISLNMSTTMSQDLKELYIYVNGLLAKAPALMSTKPLAEAEKIVMRLHFAFREVEKMVMDSLTDDKDRVMEFLA